MGLKLRSTCRATFIILLMFGTIAQARQQEVLSASTSTVDAVPLQKKPQGAPSTNRETVNNHTDSIGEDAVDVNESGEKDRTPPTPTTWKYPEVRQSSKKGRVMVIISGNTTPGANIKLAGKVINLVNIKTGKIVRLSARKALVSGFSQSFAGRNGDFKIYLDLPPGYKGHINIALMVEGYETMTFLIPIAITRNNAQIEGLKNAEKTFALSDLFVGSGGLSLGIGSTYLVYQQSLSSISLTSQLKYGSFESPTTQFEWWYNWNPSWSILGSYHNASIVARSSPEQQVINERSSWTITSLEATYQRQNWQFQPLKGYPPGQVSLRFGIQHHNVPFITGYAPDPTAVEIKNNDITMLTVGPKYTGKLSDAWLFEGYLRYQRILSTGQLYTITSQMAFDGSVGVNYTQLHKWRIGLFWYGQLHLYGYESYDSSVSETVTGEQTLFFSNIEFRLGYEF